jgi:lysozyme
MEELISSIKEHEGFRGDVYKDTLGFDTIGYGTKLPLSTYEARMLLESRLTKMIKELEEKEPFVNSLTLAKQEIIAEMCYQLGVNGVLKFVGMWKALKNNDFKEASVQMLDSRWAKQTPNRAEKLAYKMKS